MLKLSNVWGGPRHGFRVFGIFFLGGGGMVPLLPLDPPLTTLRHTTRPEHFAARPSNTQLLAEHFAPPPAPQTQLLAQRTTAQF